MDQPARRHNLPLLSICFFYLLHNPAFAQPSGNIKNDFEMAAKAYTVEQYDNAIAAYTVIRSSSGLNATEKLRAGTGLAQCHLDRGDYPLALPLLRELMPIESADSLALGDFWLALSNAWLQKGAPDSALLAAEQARKYFASGTSPERRTVLSLYAGKALMLTGYRMDAKVELEKGLAMTNAGRGGIAAAIRAGLLAVLMEISSDYGWLNYKKKNQAALDATLALLPPESIRRNRILLEYAGSYETPVADSLSRRLLEFFGRRPGSPSSASALRLRAGYMEPASAAVPLLDSAYQILMSHGSDAWPNAVALLANKARSFWKSGRARESIALYREAHAGYDHYNIYRGWNYIGSQMFLSVVYQSEGECDSADRVLQLCTQSPVYQRDSLAHIGVNVQRSKCAFTRNNSAEAMGLLNRSADLALHMAGDSSAILFNYNIVFFINNYYFNTGQHQQNISFLLRADSLAIKVYGANDWHRADLLNNLANSYSRLQNISKAEHLWNQSIELYKNSKNLDTETMASKLRGCYLDLCLINLQLADFKKVRAYLELWEALLTNPEIPNYTQELFMIARGYEVINDWDNYVRRFFKAKSVFETKQVKGQLPLLYTYNTYGLLFDYFVQTGQCDSAAIYYEQYTALTAKFESESSVLAQKNLKNAALKFLQCQGIALDSIARFMESYIDWELKFDTSDWNEIATHEGMLANWYGQLGFETKQKLHLERKLELLERIVRATPNETAVRVNYLLSKISARPDLYPNNPAQVEQAFQELFRLLPDENQRFEYLLYQLRGNYYLGQNRISEGLRDLKHLLEKGNPEDADFQTAQLEIGQQIIQTYLLEKKLDSAGVYARQVLEWTARYPGRIQEKAAALQTVSDWYRQKRDCEASLSILREVIRLFDGAQTGRFSASKVVGRPPKLPALYDRVAITYRRWFEKTGALALLDSAMLYSGYAIEAIDALSEHADAADPAARLSLRSTAYWYYDEAVRTRMLAAARHDARYRREAFTWAERGKAAQLRLLMQDQKPAPGNEKQTVLLENLKKANREIAAREKIRFGLWQKQSALDPAQRFAAPGLAGQINELYRERESLLQQLRKSAPEQYRQRYGREPVPVETIQKKLLRPGQTLLEYFYTDSVLVIFVIRPDTFLVHTQTPPPNFAAQIATFRKEIARPVEAQQFDDFFAAGRSLYEVLIAPVAPWLTEQLLVVPDGALASIPFEALLYPDSADVYEQRQRPYLLRRHSISYAVSATVQDLTLHREIPGYTIDFLGVAPAYAGLEQFDEVETWSDEPLAGTRGGFGPLLYSVLEVEDVAAGLGAGLRKKLLFREQANKETMLQELHGARIGHFAGHAKGYSHFGEYSFLVCTPPVLTPEKISDARLFARELYGHRLPAEMVVLSGCETGLGTEHVGEGVVGLGHAFAAAGVGSLALSLWQVDDPGTRELMTGFYRELQKGLPKHVALQRAKLAQLDANKSPYFWAPFVLYGDVKPLF